MEQVLIEYDGPLLFVVKAKDGKLYVGFFAALDVEKEVYWYSFISEQRYARLLRGDMDIRSVFIDAEQSQVLEMTWKRGEDDVQCLVKAPSELCDDMLPESGVRLT